MGNAKVILSNHSGEVYDVRPGQTSGQSEVIVTSRRAFIKTLALMGPALGSWESLAASPDGSRVALVIGNGAYRASPLPNPANDARAMGALLGQAGFVVDTRLDTTRPEMLTAIENFARGVEKSANKLAVFYYAGHGAQLEWQNYLVPVDAQVEAPEQFRRGCVDLNVLLGKLARFKDRTFVIILDACRNNPFGSDYHPDRAGLSQFDAPAGSLLAYATSPGNVAADGSGKNGLYTENLVRELSVPGVRLDDALKRVRLNVRLASKGEQIPWETTSLESDVRLFNDGSEKLSGADIEAQLEADIAEWRRINSSRRIEDWIGYLRKFPNGRFTEIAQVRIERLQSEDGKQSLAENSGAGRSDDPGRVEAATPAAPMIELVEGGTVPQLFKKSTNPYSAGRYRLARKFSLGDEVSWRVSDLFSGVQKWVTHAKVTSIDTDKDRVELNGGLFVYDTMGNIVTEPRYGESDIPRQLAPAELYVGNSWKAGYKLRNGSNSWAVSWDLRVVAFERVRMAIGEIDCFRIEGKGWSSGQNKNGPARLERRLWVSPGINFNLKDEWHFTRGSKVTAADRLEIISLRQRTSDIK
jgi:hypothetical protein